MWDLYLVLYSHMTSENYFSFKEFKQMSEVDERPTSQIKKEIESIEKKFES